MNKVLHMTIGLPRSGKSTWSNRTDWPIVNPDSIRLALHGQRFIGEAEPMVWIMARYMVESLFLAGHDNVILDATNTTKLRRNEWISQKWVRKFWPIPTTQEECLRRAIATDDHYIIPIINKMAIQLEWDSEDELMPWERS